MSKILDLAKSFEQTSSEQVKDTEQAVATEFKKHEERLIGLLNENEKAISNAIQEQNKRLLPTMLNAFTDVGHPSLSELQNRQERRDYRPTEPSNRGFSEERGQYQATGLHRRQEPQTLMRLGEQGRTDLEEWQPNGSDGVLIDDRIRKALARSSGASTGAATAEGSRFAQDVREYEAGQFQREKNLQRFLREYEGNRSDPKRELEQIGSASKQLELSSTRLQDAKRSTEQAIASARNASQQVQEINEPKRSYGMGFGR